MDRYFITTPIYYVNDKPHIGHTYTTFVCDALARHQRRRGARVLFSTGTDENSQKNMEAMRAAGEENLGAYLDRMAGVWKTTWTDLGITFDDFIRTTEPRHLSAVIRFWEAAMRSGDIYPGTYEGMYCTGCEAFKTENEIIDGRCPLHRNRELQRISEQNYFFRLSAYRDRLLELFSANPDFVRPASRLNEIRNYVEHHLADISVSRSADALQSGIPVPGDASQRIYVWFDALINYLTVAGFGSDDGRTRATWPPDLHLVGKDIIKFHCALWPAMLFSAAKSDPLLAELERRGGLIPQSVFAHGFFTIEGQKISKSLGNAIDPRDLVNTYGADALRYFLMREIAFGEDGDFSMNRLRERYVADLANTLGNLVQRAVAMSRRYFDRRVPDVEPDAAALAPDASVWRGREGIEEIERVYDGHMEQTRIDLALQAIWSAGLDKASGLEQANRYIEETKPFQLVKTDAPKVSEILYSLLEALRRHAWLLEPVMPETSAAIIRALGQDVRIERRKTLTELRTWGVLKPGSALPEPIPLFPRVE